MAVECRFFGLLREAVGTKSVRRDIDGVDTVGGLLADLEAEYPGLAGELIDEDGVRRSVNVSKNGRNVSLLEGADTPLTDGDLLRLTPPVKGGAPGAQRPSDGRRRPPGRSPSE